MPRVFSTVAVACEHGWLVTKLLSNEVKEGSQMAVTKK